jgi:hypothetical protein
MVSFLFSCAWICAFSCSNETLQRLFSPQENVKNISTLNIVLDTDEIVKTDISKQNFVKNVWVFIINGSLDGKGIQPVREYFTNFLNISLKSSAYSFVKRQGKEQLFEVYRCQFYQHFMSSFYVPKLHMPADFLWLKLGFDFFGARKLAKQLILKCWWN